MSSPEMQETLMKALVGDKQSNPTEEPQNNEPQNGEPQNEEPQNGEPQNDEPQNGEPQNDEPQNGEPQNEEPQNEESLSVLPHQAFANISEKIQNNEKNQEEEENFSPHPPDNQNSDVSNSSSSPKRAPRNKPHDNASTTENSELSPLAQRFYAGEQVYENDPQLLKDTISELEAYCEDLMERGSYQESRQAQSAVEAAQQAYFTYVKKKAQEKELNEVRSRQNDLQKKYTDFQTEMDRRQQQLEELLKQQYDDMCQKHEKELEKHDEEWHSELKSRQFNRSSQTLRNLRTQQQLLLNAKRFEEASQIREIADQTEKQEIQQSQQAYINAYKQSRFLLKRKQANELDTYEKAAEGRRMEFRHFRETKAIPYIKQLQALKIQEDGLQDENKIWIRKHRNDPLKKNSSLTSRSSKNTFSKTVKVEKFNKLPLPGLPILQTKKSSQSASNSARVSSQSASNSNRKSYQS